MKLTDYVKLIEEIAKSPDDLTKLDKLKDEITADLTTLETLTSENTNLTNKVKDLRDTNMKLFLKNGSTVETKEPEKEKTNDEIFDELITKQLSEEN